MPQYLSPGVYVEEVPSAIKPIAGVSTSTACFVGVIPDSVQIPEQNPKYDPTGKSAGDDTKKPFILRPFPADAKAVAKQLEDAQKAVSADDKKDSQKTKDLQDALK